MTPDRDPLGKRALFSAPDEGNRHGPLDVTVHCSSCDTTTTLSPASFLAARFPVSAWIPIRRHSHYMRCPSCHKLTWLSASRAG
jgi:hypothetical protein